MSLQPAILLNAYSQGFFPMAEADGTIYWYDPDPRAILPLDAFHVPRRLARVVRQGRFEVRVDTAFEAVIRACAEPSPGREQTWISEEIIAAYTQLHRLGYAHSVESWREGKLVGGLYGVALRGLFAGESMFSRQRDASKVALVHLVERLRAGGFQLLDVQFMTEHLRRFGAVEIPRWLYKRRLARAMQVSAWFAPP
ncbi:MAG: leucyl/phenylalanyl-tRNA--protein transferase [Caldilineae bacterium]|nr:MAG: leucyl/phenylalanyl-tRNA--protein transferase [Caldilineae bacterium]